MVNSRSPASAASASRTSERQADPKKALGMRIKELRAQQGLTQEELADRSGLFRTYMSRIESGQANPTLTMLCQIAAAFHVDPRELLAPPSGVPPARVLRGAVRVSRGRVSR